ncbi:MAG: extradiol dioxygenase [Hyphomonadaceae bacterium]
MLGFPHVDVGLPPSEPAIHPGEQGDTQEFHFMVDDMTDFIGEMTKRGRVCRCVSQQRWGSLTTLELPSGATVGVNEPKHPRPQNPG